MRLNNPTAAICLALIAAPIMYGQAGQPAGSGLNDRPTPAVPAPPAPTNPLPTKNALEVDCQGDQLTIASNDSTLASILAEVRKCTGTQIDLPDGTGDIRFFDTIGPGPIRQVLVSLFSATGLNFAIESSDTDPQKVQAVVLMARTDKATTEVAGDHPLTPARRAYLQMLQQNPRSAASQAPGDSSEAADSENQATDQSPPPPPENSRANSSQEPSADPSTAPATVATPPATDVPPPSTPSAAQDSGQPNTVNDQITSMQQMFEQRRQMMQNPAPPSQ